ncbi:CitMHS family transporter [Rhizobium oryzicola]|uniref:Citrate:proton symporter n=1 Tax=Rhizobium oryzicola TaxID=1232668 RepID=A0ABT8SW77_9HYPH|nr:citrate:proton symporter [Rhizobium oryzicola]MDO1582560.1 citrate:proton symporter [Rhizobium oryzicola]
MLAYIGLFVVVLSVAILMSGRVSPVVTFTAIPLVGAFLAGNDIPHVQKFVLSGLSTVAPMVVIFIFAIVYFGIMYAQGIFEPLIRLLLKFAGNRPHRILMATVVTAALVHLDGAGPTTYLVTISAFLPIYRRFQISPLHLAMLTGLMAGIMNIEPWTPAVLRAATVLHVDPAALWRPLWPAHLAGICSSLALAWWVGRNLPQTGLPEQSFEPAADGNALGSESISDNWKRAANTLLTLATIATMVFSGIPLGIVMMIAVAIALPLNYNGSTAQMAAIKKHGAEAVSLSAIILAAGVFLGILNDSGMLDALAKLLISLIPANLGSSVHLIVGILALPLGMMFGGDTYYFGILPVLVSVGKAHGVAPEAVARAMLIGENVGYSISPVIGSAYMLVGLAGVDFAAHIRHSVFYMWSIALIMLAIAFFSGAL